MSEFMLMQNSLPNDFLRGYDFELHTRLAVELISYRRDWVAECWRRNQQRVAGAQAVRRAHNTKRQPYTTTHTCIAFSIIPRTIYMLLTWKYGAFATSNSHTLAHLRRMCEVSEYVHICSLQAHWRLCKLICLLCFLCKHVYVHTDYFDANAAVAWLNWLSCCRSTGGNWNVAHFSIAANAPKTHTPTHARAY